MQYREQPSFMKRKILEKITADTFPVALRRKIPTLDSHLIFQMRKCNGEWRGNPD